MSSTPASKLTTSDGASEGSNRKRDNHHVHTNPFECVSENLNVSRYANINRA
jgi:hypothetical protein